MSAHFTRRHFLKTLAATATTSVFLSPSNPGKTANLPLLKPARLKPGSLVGIVSPASATFEQNDLDIVQDAVKALGLVPKLSRHLLDRYGYLAGQDKNRAADLNQMFADPEVAAILPIRGGWGCSRVLPYLDYNLIRQNPKIIVGFSDITALTLAIYSRTGILTFHGPNGLTSWKTKQTEYFRRVLFAGESVTFKNLKDGDDEDRLMQVKYRIRTINPGIARGRLIGGNLSVLSGIVGSPYLPDLKGAILFLEDTNETIYSIDRMMTHLKIAGVFDKLVGFIFGQCTTCSPDADYGSLTLEEVILDHIKPLGIPAWSGAMIGHIEPILTLPIGLEVEIDSRVGTIRMLEPAVI
jgi:muramoyltetrapeptide carboxypeptidase